MASPATSTAIDLCACTESHKGVSFGCHNDCFPGRYFGLDLTCPPSSGSLRVPPETFFSSSSAKCLGGLEVDHQIELGRDRRELDISDLGPIAVTMEGSAVQDVVTDDARLRGLDVLIIDYDTDGAAETYDVPQKASNGAITHVATACLSDRAIGKATGIHLSELWGHFLLNSPGNHEASPSAPSMVA
jgi:hypothetical protein